MKMTPWLFVKLWLRLSFSSAMWCSWYFIMFYVLILLSNIQDENLTVERVAKQGMMMVVVALFFGMIGSIAGWLHWRKCQQVERETQQRMEAADRWRKEPWNSQKLPES